MALDQLYRRLIALCGGLVILLGLVVIGGWYLQIPVLLQIRADYATMQYLTASGFVLCGVALISAMVWGRSKIGVLCGGCVGLVGLVLCLEYLLGVKLGVDAILNVLPSFPGHLPKRPSPATASCFFICGSGLVGLASNISRQQKRVIVWLAGSITLAICVMGIFGYATQLRETLEWGGFSGMAAHTVTGMAVLSIGLLLTQVSSAEGRRLREDRWLPVPIMTATATASLILWQALLLENQNAAKVAAETVAHSLGIDMKARVEFRLRALQRMAERWSVAGGSPEKIWRADADTLLRDEKIFRSIQWVDSSFHVRWVMPETASPVLAGMDLSKDERWSAAAGLRLAEEKRQSVLSPIINFKRGGRGFVAYFPISSSAGFDGFIAGGIGLDDFLRDVVSEAQGNLYYINVISGNETIYSNISRGIVPLRMMAEKSVNFSGMALRIAVRARGNSSWTGGIAHIILFTGLALSAAMGIAVRSQQISKIRAAALEDSYAKLQTTHSLLEAAGRISRLGHWEVALDGSSPIWSDMTYVIHEVPVGTPVSLEDALAFFSPADRHIIQNLLKRSIETGGPFEYEMQLTTRSGNLIWVYSRGEPVFDGQGKVVGLRGVFQDISERYKASALLIQNNLELQAATQKAENAGKAKADFLANMSHEIRTPLNAMVGMSDLLHETSLEDRQREMVDTIRLSGDVLLTLINDILDFSKIEAGHLELESLPVDVHECVESAFDLVSQQAERKKLDLLYWIDPVVPTYVTGDITRLRQVLVNLVTNAVKFTARGEVFIKVTKQEGEGAGLLRFSVSDTGIGIPADRLHRLFKAFSQVDSSTTRRFGGTGLGLAICYKIIKAMNGRIWVESEEGKGSEFQFEIPLRPAALAVGVIDQGEGLRDPDGLNVLEGVSVLIVVEGRTNRWILNEWTARWGMQPTEAANPSEALERIDRGDFFDMIILDDHIPLSGGSEFISRIRAQRAKRGLPVLVLSSVENSRGYLTDGGVSDVLIKPVHMAALYESMKTNLRGGSVVRQVIPTEKKILLSQECPLRILVAEDNTVNQRVITLILDKMGYRCEMTANGKEVLVALERRQFDVLLLDVQMPEMDGLQTAREICNRYAAGDRPRIIALTADASTEDREICIASGMDDYMSKPVRNDKLVEALKTAYRMKFEGGVDGPRP
jgi:signal transduction histidine kinase/DNA-binding response OmpR family regulator/sensor domain CHASE-containing protein